MDEPWSELEKCGDWLLSIAQRSRPTCVHLNHYAHTGLPWGVPALVVGHSCVLSWWRAVRGEAAPERYRRYRELVTRGLAAAGCVVAPSLAMLRALQSHYGPIARARVIPNGIDAGLFRPAPKQQFVLSAGRLWDGAKNVAALAQAAPGLPWPVYVAGELRGPDGELGEHGTCTGLGQLSRHALAEHMAMAEIFAAPARYEPFGLSVLEAAHSQCALVLGRVPSLLENWSDAASFVDPEDPAELRQAIFGLIVDAQKRHQLARAAQLRARSFGADAMAMEYQRSYRELEAGPFAEKALPCAS
jgi:glycosyltransferase involved in cell wall biosynthesis